MGDHDRNLINELLQLHDIATDVEEALAPTDSEALLTKLELLQQQAFELHGLRTAIEAGALKLNVAVIGNFSSGKSSFINSLLGREVCPVKACPTTSSVTRFMHGDEQRIVLSNDNRDICQNEYDELVCHASGTDAKTPVYSFDYHYPFTEFRHVMLVDTPGFGNPKNVHDTEVTLRAAREADIIFFVFDAGKLELGQDTLAMLERIREGGNSDGAAERQWHVVLNKCDNLRNDKQVARVTKQLKKRANGLFAGHLPYSSKLVLERRTGHEEQLRSLTEKLIDDLANRETVTASITGRAQDGKYSIRIDESEFVQPPPPRTTLASERDVLQLFREFRLRKRDYLQSRLGRAESSYEGHRRDTMGALKRKIITAAKSLPPSDEAETFDSREHSLMASILKCLKVAVKEMHEECVTPNLKERGFIWDTWEVSFSQSDMMNRLSGSQAYNAIRDDLNNLSKNADASGEMARQLSGRWGFAKLKSESIDLIHSATLSAFQGHIFPERDSKDEMKDAIHVAIKAWDAEHIARAGCEPFRIFVAKHRDNLRATLARDKGRADKNSENLKRTLEKIEALLNNQSLVPRPIEGNET